MRIPLAAYRPPSAGDRVVVRWTGDGTRLGEIDGVAATGSATPVDVLSVHRIGDGKIAQTWAVWDTLTFLQPIGVLPEKT